MGNRFIRVVFGFALSALMSAAQADPAEFDPVEFPVENAALVRATVDFFDTVEARTAPRTRMPVIGLPLTVTKSAAGQGDTGILTRMGPVRHLTGYRITWYPMDRFLGTVDFMGTWDGNRNLVCGYLTWDLSDPQAPVLEAVSASFVDMGELARGTAEDIHLGLLEANCAFGSVDENYRLFDAAS